MLFLFNFKGDFHIAGYYHITLILSAILLQGQRQTMMFSATFPEDIQRLAQDYLNNYLFIVVGIVGGACTDVQQIFEEVARFDKKEKLKEILSQTDG